MPDAGTTLFTLRGARFRSLDPLHTLHSYTSPLLHSYTSPLAALAALLYASLSSSGTSSHFAVCAFFRLVTCKELVVMRCAASLPHVLYTGILNKNELRTLPCSPSTTMLTETHAVPWQSTAQFKDLFETERNSLVFSIDVSSDDTRGRSSLAPPFRAEHFQSFGRLARARAHLPRHWHLVV